MQALILVVGAMNLRKVFSVSDDERLVLNDIVEMERLFIAIKSLDKVDWETQREIDKLQHQLKIRMKIYIMYFQYIVYIFGS